MTINLKKTALVVIDMQENIVTNELSPNSSELIIKNTNKLIDFLKEKIGLIVLVNAGATSKNSKDWPSVINDENFRVNFDPEGLKLVINDPKTENIVHITKHNWGAFYGTDLDLNLRRREIDTIILTGVLTSIGVDTTAREAYSHDYNQLIISDAISDIDSTLHEEIITKILPKIAKIVTTEKFISEIN